MVSLVFSPAFFDRIFFQRRWPGREKGGGRAFMTAMISTRNARRMAGKFVKNNSETRGKKTSYVLKTEVTYQVMKGG